MSDLRTELQNAVNIIRKGLANNQWGDVSSDEIDSAEEVESWVQEMEDTLVGKFQLCPYHEESLGFDACSDGYESTCFVNAARAAEGKPSDDVSRYAPEVTTTTFGQLVDEDLFTLVKDDGHWIYEKLGPAHYRILGISPVFQNPDATNGMVQNIASYAVEVIKMDALQDYTVTIKYSDAEEGIKDEEVEVEVRAGNEDYAMISAADKFALFTPADHQEVIKVVRS